jgi:hypothetical protein
MGERGGKGIAKELNRKEMERIKSRFIASEYDGKGMGDRRQ